MNIYYSSTDMLNTKRKLIQLTFSTVKYLLCDILIEFLIVTVNYNGYYMQAVLDRFKLCHALGHSFQKQDTCSASRTGGIRMQLSRGN